MSPSLPPIPPTYTTTREALHLVAEQVVAPARTKATGNEIALEVRAGGFGTPPFPDGGWVAVDGDLLVCTAADGTVHEHRLTTLHAAVEWAGLDADASDRPLHVDPVAADVLGAVYAFADGALRTLRAEASPAAAPSPIRLWPEHFDLAYEEGDEAAGQRAGFGVSPGDDEHAEAYAYVSPWTAPPADPLWNATAFPGAELAYADLLAAADPAAAVLDFFRARRDALQNR
jgi:hypothetical protein